MNQIKNLEQSFAEWLQRTMPESYRQYLGSSVSQTKDRLGEINKFFPEKAPEIPAATNNAQEEAHHVAAIISAVTEFRKQS